MKVEILSEHGYALALFGLGFSKGITSEMEFNDFWASMQYNQMAKVAQNLSPKDGGHNKFLESIMVWLDIDAPRYWWQQVDTYRCPEDGEGGFLPTGITKQSESTMHTILKRPLVQDDFELPIDRETLWKLNHLIEEKKFKKVKNELPEGFLQRREVVTNYKALRYIYQQRETHKLQEWQSFWAAMEAQLDYPEFIKC